MLSDPNRPLYEVKAGLFKGLAHPIRIRILEVLSAAPEASVSELLDGDLARGLAPVAAPRGAASQPARRRRSARQPRLLPARRTRRSPTCCAVARALLGEILETTAAPARRAGGLPEIPPASVPRELTPSACTTGSHGPRRGTGARHLRSLAPAASDYRDLPPHVAGRPARGRHRRHRRAAARARVRRQLRRRRRERARHGDRRRVRRRGVRRLERAGLRSDRRHGRRARPDRRRARRGRARAWSACSPGSSCSPRASLRLGRAVTYIPWPVIEGFTLGIAVIIFLQQVPAALGVAPGRRAPNAARRRRRGDRHGRRGRTLAWCARHRRGRGGDHARRAAHPPALPRLDLAIVVVSVVAAGSRACRVATIGELPPRPARADAAARRLGDARAAARPGVRRSRRSPRSSRCCRRASPPRSPTPARTTPTASSSGRASRRSRPGFFGGMPATGAIARTAVNVRSGGRTRLAAIAHARAAARSSSRSARRSSPRSRWPRSRAC